MSEELYQNESHSQSSVIHIFLKMFSFLVPLLDVIKIVIASVTSVVFLAFAGITLAGSAVALAVSTPLFVVFSPILVPATLATTLLATGLTTGASLGLTAIGLIMGTFRTFLPYMGGSMGGGPPMSGSPLMPRHSSMGGAKPKGKKIKSKRGCKCKHKRRGGSSSGEGKSGSRSSSDSSSEESSDGESSRSSGMKRKGPRHAHGSMFIEE